MTLSFLFPDLLLRLCVLWLDLDWELLWFGFTYKFCAFCRDFSIEAQQAGKVTGASA